MGSLFEYKKIFIIDSAARNSGTGSNFTFVLPIESGLRFDKIALQDIVLPLTMYLVRAGLNTFTLKEGAQTATVTVPVGNYSYLSFMAILPGLISAASPNGLTYTMSWPGLTTAAQTGKYTYTQSNGAIQSSFIFGNGIAEQMGFTKGATVAFLGTNLVSTGVVNFALPNVVYLQSNAVRATNYNTILQELYVTGPPYSDMQWQNPNIDATSRDLQTNDQNEYSFALVDENLTEIDLNGANFVFSIILYKESTFQKMARSFFLMLQYVIAKSTGSLNPVWAGESPDYGNA